MNQLYPIIRRARRPLVDVNAATTPSPAMETKPSQMQQTRATEETEKTQTTPQSQAPNVAQATDVTDLETKADASDK
jgi:hypothetical protein